MACDAVPRLGPLYEELENFRQVLLTDMRHMVALLLDGQTEMLLGQQCFATHPCAPFTNGANAVTAVLTNRKACDPPDNFVSDAPLPVALGPLASEATATDVERVKSEAFCGNFGNDATLRFAAAAPATDTSDNCSPRCQRAHGDIISSRAASDGFDEPEASFSHRGAENVLGSGVDVPMRWQLHMGGGWVDFNSEVSQQLNDAKAKGRRSTQFKLGTDRYEVNFEALTQTRLTTKRVRYVQCAKAEAEAAPHGSVGAHLPATAPPSSSSQTPVRVVAAGPRTASPQHSGSWSGTPRGSSNAPRQRSPPPAPLRGGALHGCAPQSQAATLTVDLWKMVQRTSRTERKVRQPGQGAAGPRTASPQHSGSWSGTPRGSSNAPRQRSPPPAPLRGSQAMAKWQVLVPHEDWIDMDDAGDAALRANTHQRYVSFEARGQSYSVDLLQMVQINKTSGTERRVRRPGQGAAGALHGCAPQSQAATLIVHLWKKLQRTSRTERKVRQPGQGAAGTSTKPSKP
eukprot:NODE_2205_length_2267_cov_12.527103.p1 GENE.NODE_2205_length_2267_cov_12.527103~~NODE_2205_length_2267_cov_12.527103.p1  ORF type:complete len:515 (+),score=102.13 NODE_2205_length_2267_cov_12.527103:91-1635(+)